MDQQQVTQFVFKPIGWTPVDCIKELFSGFNIDKKSIAQGCPVNNLAVEMASVDDGFRKISRGA